MIAKVTNVTKSTADFQHPQIDISVEYEDSRFPIEGKRLFIFTLPHEKFESLSEGELEKMIRAQGEEFKNILQKGEEMVTIETTFKELVGTEFDI